MAFENPQQYNDPHAAPSTIGPQMNVYYWQKQALIEARKEQYFSQLADVTSMPKHYGKKIKRYHYLPLLDDRNINDQGIDAAGVVIDSSKFSVRFPALVLSFTVEADATNLAAAINAVQAGFAVKAGAASPWTVTLDELVLPNATEPQSSALKTQYPAAIVSRQSGNLYGSSKDIGTITGKLPLLSENGGRVNRVGFKRKELEGTFEKFGFFDEYTQDSLDFDSDSELMQHVTRELVTGANEITEDALQIDLINAAGVVRYAGAATENRQVSAVVSYGDFMRTSIDLDNNRTPKHTRVISGTRMIDTRVIPAARVLYCGSEMLPTLRAMKDLHNNPAFIPVEQYAAAGSTLTGEAGTIDAFRVVIVPEMLKWANAGAPLDGATDSHGEGNYDVFPLLVIGDGSFTTIGFQTDGKTVKFKIYHKKPGEATADRNDPYGETGFMSIKWWYGFMVLRSERIALIKSAAKL